MSLGWEECGWRQASPDAQAGRFEVFRSCGRLAVVRVQSVLGSFAMSHLDRQPTLYVPASERTGPMVGARRSAPAAAVTGGVQLQSFSGEGRARGKGQVSGSGIRFEYPVRGSVSGSGSGIRFGSTRALPLPDGERQTVTILRRP